MFQIWLEALPAWGPVLRVGLALMDARQKGRAVMLDLWAALGALSRPIALAAKEGERFGRVKRAP